MYKERCVVLENRSVAPEHFVLKLQSYQIGKNAKPGQFVQILCSDDTFDPLLARPFSFLNTGGNHFSILYHVVGTGTELMSKLKPKDQVSILGPLGNGFTCGQDPKKKKVVLVGGGVGIPPLFHLAETLLKNKFLKKEDLEVFLGARTKNLLLCESEFKKLGARLFVSTNDGSKGTKGIITEPLLQHLKSRDAGSKPRLFTCGPTPMLKAVSAIAEKLTIACEVAVEVPMACGFGACLGCAIKVKASNNQPRAASRELPAQDYRYAIACTEGPVFEGAKILWD